MTLPVANPQLTATGTVAASGDNTLIAAPGAGKRLIVSALILQNESAVATTMIVKGGATAVLRCLAQEPGDGLALHFAPQRELQLGPNAALLLNLSGANAHGYSVIYHVDAVGY